MKAFLLSLISFSLAQLSDTQCLSERESQYNQQMEKLITELSKLKIEPNDFEKSRENLMLEFQRQQTACQALAQQKEEPSQRAPTSVEGAIEFVEIESSDVAE